MRFLSTLRMLAVAAIIATPLASCGNSGPGQRPSDPAEASFLSIKPRDDGGWELVSVSPFGGSSDTLVIDRPLDNLIVMSTSHIGFLDALGKLDVISGVSGKDFIYSGSGGYADVGHEGAPDYEKIVSLKPDLLLTYTVSGAKSTFLDRLEQLGIRVFIVNEHLERHPLARASYIRLFGALTGRMEAADSILTSITASYQAIASRVEDSGEKRKKVLLNIPYNDTWFVPSKESYLWSMFQDAGGEILGAEAGKTASGMMSLEKAYSLGKEADCWMNVGWCQTREQLVKSNPIFKEMIDEIGENSVWNDNKRLNAKGGNDIWESGVARPDLVLRDLVQILHPGLLPRTDTLVFYRQIL